MDLESWLTTAISIMKSKSSKRHCLKTSKSNNRKINLIWQAWTHKMKLKWDKGQPGLTSKCLIPMLFLSRQAMVNIDNWILLWTLIRGKIKSWIEALMTLIKMCLCPLKLEIKWLKTNSQDWLRSLGSLTKDFLVWMERERI